MEAPELACCPMPDLLARCGREWPDRIAVDFLGKRLRYGALDALVDRAAAGLQQLGIAPGDRVGLCLPNVPYFVVFYFAIMRAGGTVVHYNPLYTERELRTQIADSGTTIMVVPDLRAISDKVEAVADASGLRHVVVCPMAAAMPAIKGALYSIARRREITHPGRRGRVVPYKALLATGEPLRRIVIDPRRDIALLQYTGGTTGTPKGACLTHANLSANAAQVAHNMMQSRPPGGDEPERILGVLPLFHVFALTTVLNLAVTIGAEMILLPRFVVADTLAAIARRRPTLLPAVPTIYNALSNAAEAASPKVRAGLRAIRACISGGAPLPAEIKTRFETLTGCHLVEGYGQSETSPVVCCNALGDAAPAGSVGRVVPGTIVEIRSLEDPAIVLGPGERGEVSVRGPQVMAGYWRRPEDTEAVMIDGAVRTGDVGYVDEAGYLFLIDRIKDVILCGGYNVYPRMIEEALYRHPDVLEATVIGIPDSYRGETPKAFVVLRPEATVDAAGLKRFLEGEISRIEMPREVELRNSLPHTTVGKLSKKELVAEEAARRRQNAA